MQNLILMQQVHGNNVVIVDSKDIGTTIPDCDAIITSDSKVTLGVRVADCLPISVTDIKGRAMGIIHAGWRGLDNGIIGKTIEEICRKFKIKNYELKINIGPHICVDHTEVKNDVAPKFVKYPGGVLKKDGKTFLDLAKVAGFQLISIGVKKENIKIDKRCTFEDLTLPSFRRDKTSERIVVELNIQSS